MATTIQPSLKCLSIAHLYGRPGPRQCGGRETGGEDEARPETPDHVHCPRGTGDVTPNVPKGFTCVGQTQSHLLLQP